MDLEIVKWINGFAGEFIFLDASMMFLSNYVIYMLIGLLIVLVIFSINRLYAFIALVVSFWVWE
ncbi:hypothetical protein LG329_12555 [Virgibacillus necropolis]|uniref:hypothetical protein n=1 Tax=Virgibacillus necropolis TaxID=163877 RepID=UPI00384AD393